MCISVPFVVCNELTGEYTGCSNENSTFEDFICSKLRRKENSLDFLLSFSICINHIFFFFLAAMEGSLLDVGLRNIILSFFVLRCLTPSVAHAFLYVICRTSVVFQCCVYAFPLPREVPVLPISQDLLSRYVRPGPLGACYSSNNNFHFYSSSNNVVFMWSLQLTHSIILTIALCLVLNGFADLFVKDIVSIPYVTQVKFLYRLLF